MLLRRAVAAASGVRKIPRFAIAISYQFSTGATTPHFSKPFSIIPCKIRRRIVYKLQEALTDYLHLTRSLPLHYADNIARYSPHSLSEVVSKIRFSPSEFVRDFERFLRYHPIDERKFFFESIGLIGGENAMPPSVLPPDTYFISDCKHFNVACVLVNLGFPWNKLGILFKDDCFVLQIDPSELKRTFREISDGYGFSAVSLVSICLVFPPVLYGNMDGLLSDLKVLFLDHDLASSVHGGIDPMIEVCEKIKLFYDLGCEKGKVGELMGRSKHIFVEYTKVALIRYIDYFCKLNVQKDQIGLLLLSKPEVLDFDLQNRVISVSGFLKQLGLERNDLTSLEQKYPHVFGRNKIGNLPSVMRSLDLGEWFFEKIKNGGHSLLGCYALTSIDEDMDKVYIDSISKLRAKTCHAYAFAKLGFLHGIGFGENTFAVKALVRLQGTPRELQDRFNYILSWGIEYSSLCRIVKFYAEILNQRKSNMEKKLNFLCTEMGLSVKFLDSFPAYMQYSLEDRIKPRLSLHKWLVEQGFCKNEYEISTILAASETAFVDHLSRIHPPSVKEWMRCKRERVIRRSSQMIDNH